MSSTDGSNSRSYTYNNSGAIDVSAVRNNTEMGDALETMKLELLHAKEAGILATDLEGKVRLSLTQAAREVRTPVPSKPTLIDHLEDARQCLAEAHVLPELQFDLTSAAQIVQGLP